MVAGNGISGIASHQLSSAYGMYVDANGTIYVADYYNHRIQQWLPNATNGTTVAGTNRSCIRNDTGLCYPTAIYVDTQQYMYIADGYGIRRWLVGASSGTLMNGSTSLSWIGGLDMDRNGNLYASVTYSNSIMMWSSPIDGPIIVAGGNGWGYSSTQLPYPYGLSVDSSTNALYVASYNMNNIVAWKINATSGAIVAGRNGTVGVSSYTLRYPRDVKCDAFGNLYVLDFGNNRLVMKCSGSSDLALKAVIDENLFYPHSMALDSQSNIYVFDGSTSRVLKYNRLP